MFKPTPEQPCPTEKLVMLVCKRCLEEKCACENWDDDDPSLPSNKQGSLTLSHPERKWVESFQYTASLGGICGICKQHNWYCRCRPVNKEE